MPHELNPARMAHLSKFKGSIGLEEIGSDKHVDIVVRIPMFREPAADAYYELGTMS